MKIIFVLANFFILHMSVISSKHYCGIDKIKIPKRTLIKQENENYRMLKEDNWEKIRIHVDFSQIENNLGIFDKNDLIDLKEKVIPKTKQIFESLLKVKRIQNKLKLNNPECDNLKIPEYYKHEGVDADVVVFVQIDDTGNFLRNNIEAAATHCLQHYETKRPIAGYIQFKPELFVTNSTAVDYMVWLAVHEITHILAINMALYEDYINPLNLVPLGLNNVIGNKHLGSGAKMSYIKTEKVLEKAKDHFGCDQLEGVPLEYNGGQGTAGAHWSKKYMNTDYMIGDSYGENLISNITLALFEDSGWYKVNYELSNLFLWGKNAGCEFLNTDKKCIEKDHDTAENMEKKPFPGVLNGKNLGLYKTDFKSEFCTNFNYPICSTSLHFRGTCKVKQYPKNLNAYEQYFKDPKIGGVDNLTDKCPIPIEVRGGQSYYGGSCRVGSSNNLNHPSIEKICPECACFMSTLKENEEPSSRKNKIFDLNLEKNKTKINDFTDYAVEMVHKNSNIRKEKVQINLSSKIKDKEKLKSK